MDIIALLFTGITCLLHGYFCFLEMFLWTTPWGLKTFGMDLGAAKTSARLAANQGLYNGLLAFGLLLSFFLPDLTSSMAIRRYCLSFIVVAGCYGAYSLKSPRVFAIQSLPAIIALAANEAAHPIG